MSHAEAIEDEGLMGTGRGSGDRSASARRSVLDAGGAPGPTVTALQRLAAEVGHDHAIVERFVSDYLGLLDKRLEGLARLLRGEDDEATNVSILSLETTSAMLGATDVVSCAGAVRDAVEYGSDELVTQAFGQLQQSVRALQSSLGGLGFSGPRQGFPTGG